MAQGLSAIYSNDTASQSTLPTLRATHSREMLSSDVQAVLINILGPQIFN